MIEKNISKRYILLRLILLIVFCFSLYEKIISHKDFVEYLVSVLGISFMMGVVISNMIIAVELYLIVQYLVAEQSDIQIFKQTLTVLVFFSIYIVFLLLFTDIQNCFCFGNKNFNTPVVSILKNIALTIIIFLLVGYKQILSAKLLSRNASLKYLFSFLLIQFLFLTPSNKYQEVFNKLSVVNLNHKLKNEHILIIDARARALYSISHIPEAINYPYYYQRATEISITEMNNYNEIVVYCDSDLCSLSKGLARVLMNKYPNKNIYILIGGLEEWQKKYSVL